MSILVTHLVPQGLIFAADRNITTSISGPQVKLIGQKQRPKLLKWPNADVLVVYVGAGAISGQPTDLWLYDFIGRNLHFPDLAGLASNLRDDLNAALASGDLRAADSLILHLGGFEDVGGDWTPRVWFVHNTAGLRPRGGYIPGTTFTASEEIAQPVYFGSDTGSQIHTKVVTSVAQGGLFSFRQGIDLIAFNILDEAIRAGLYMLTRKHPNRSRHAVPTTLDEWEKHVRMEVLTFGSYFASFYEAFEQYVGGADVMSVPWPGR